MLLLKFNELLWYKLSRENQIAYAHTLNRLQKGCVIRMGPFDHLNFATLSQVRRTFSMDFEQDFNT